MQSPWEGRMHLKLSNSTTRGAAKAALLQQPPATQPVAAGVVLPLAAGAAAPAVRGAGPCTERAGRANFCLPGTTMRRISGRGSARAPPHTWRCHGSQRPLAAPTPPRRPSALPCSSTSLPASLVFFFFCLGLVCCCCRPGPAAAMPRKRPADDDDEDEEVGWRMDVGSGLGCGGLPELI